MMPSHLGREIALKLQQSKEENEELNKLTGEMQSAHARLLVMFQNMAEQKKGEAPPPAPGNSGELKVSSLDRWPQFPFIYCLNIAIRV